jgi:hypothetical protein
VLPDAVDVALAGSAGDAEKIPLTDFCNRPTARAPTEPLDSLALTRLATSSAKVEGSVDAVPPASAVRSTLFRHGAAKADSARGRGAPDRTGPTLRGRVSASRRARRSTSDAPCRRLVRPARVSSFQTARTASTTSPSRDAAFTTQSAFHQQVPPRGLLAQDTEEPATVLEALPPATRLPAIPLGLLLNIRRFPACAAPLHLFAKKLHSLRPEACAPDGRQIGLTACQLLQSLRFLSTTVDMTPTPQALPEVTPLHRF